MSLSSLSATIVMPCPALPPSLPASLPPDDRQAQVSGRGGSGAVGVIADMAERGDREALVRQVILDGV